MYVIISFLFDSVINWMLGALVRGDDSNKHTYKHNVAQDGIPQK